SLTGREEGLAQKSGREPSPAPTTSASRTRQDLRRAPVSKSNRGVASLGILKQLRRLRTAPATAEPIPERSYDERSIILVHLHEPSDRPRRRRHRCQRSRRRPAQPRHRTLSYELEVRGSGDLADDSLRRGGLRKAPRLHVAGAPNG